ncbi:hypothetical protein DFH08DRAFT_279224 [Mycena albidolilacea]|uniref:Uncharacterized protein n=1 Tax=Mycena albidolilacea TaxID=1033008 RepID=A0AAD7AQ42_9AGAR|nr:hypothetical protein DFH08DRAFT_279224 [Mycena albidolilacea]
MKQSTGPISTSLRLPCNTLLPITMSDSYNQGSNPQASNNRADQFDGSNAGLQKSTHVESSHAAERGFNDYHQVTQIGRGGLGSNNQDGFGTSARAGGDLGGTSAMDHGAGNSGGFDAGSAAAGSGTYGTSGGNFGASSGMDHNSGPGIGGGFDVGSGADPAARGDFGGTSAMDHNSGPGNSGGFDVGSGAASGGYPADHTTSSSNEYAGTSNDYGAAPENYGGKPSVGDKIKGGAEKIVGKVTKNPELVERGQQRKEGAFANNAGAGGYGESTGQNYQ